MALNNSEPIKNLAGSKDFHVLLGKSKYNYIYFPNANFYNYTVTAAILQGVYNFWNELNKIVVEADPNNSDYLKIGINNYTMPETTQTAILDVTVTITMK